MEIIRSPSESAPCSVGRSCPLSPTVMLWRFSTNSRRSRSAKFIFFVFEISSLILIYPCRKKPVEGEMAVKPPVNIIEALMKGPHSPLFV